MRRSAARSQLAWGSREVAAMPSARRSAGARDVHNGGSGARQAGHDHRNPLGRNARRDRRHALGVIMVPVNPDYGEQEARYVLEHAEVCGVIASPETLARVQAVCEGMKAPTWLMLNEAAPAHRAIPVLADAALACEAPVPVEAGTAARACVFIYTSGTTGFPKGVLHSQRILVMAGEGFVARMHLQPEDRLQCVLPMFRINAIFYSFAAW